MNVFSHPIIDAINRKSLGARVLIIGVMPNIIFPSILEEARSMAIDHFKEEGIYVKFDLQLVFLLTSVQSFMGTSKDGQCCHAKSGESVAWRGLLPAAMESCSPISDLQNEEPDHVHHRDGYGV